MSDSEQTAPTVVEDIPAVEENVTQAVADVVEEVKHNVPATPAESTHKSVKAILKENPLAPAVTDVLHWRDPIRSGLVFGIITSSYILLGWFDYTVVTLVSYLLFALLAVCFLYATGIYVRNTFIRGQAYVNPFTENFKKTNFQMSKAEASHHLHTFLDLVNLTVHKFTDVFFITNRIAVAKYLFIFYISAIVGEWFSGLSLAYIGTLAAFIWPRLYEEKKREIDQVFGLIDAEYKKYSALVISKLPPVVRNFAGVSVEKKRD